jgi:hypothetical protein
VRAAASSLPRPLPEPSVDRQIDDQHQCAEGELGLARQSSRLQRRQEISGGEIGLRTGLVFGLAQPEFERGQRARPAAEFHRGAPRRSGHVQTTQPTAISMPTSPCTPQTARRRDGELRPNRRAEDRACFTTPGRCLLSPPAVGEPLRVGGLKWIVHRGQDLPEGPPRVRSGSQRAQP